MMTIEDEVHSLITFLRHPAGFDVDMAGLLCIRPISEDSPPTYWEVDWEDHDGTVTYKYAKEFTTLEEAAQFFVEKRRYLCLGLDFEKILLE